MKKVFSIAITVLFTAVTVFSFQLAYSQSEPTDTYNNVADFCYCVDENGFEIGYGFYYYCEDGGSEPCLESDCPPPPPPCM